jgi:nucleoside-diphosphate-sugar epimerase
MKSALIIGCGYAGSFLARRLLARGVEVVGTTLGGAAGGPGSPELLSIDLRSTRVPRFPELCGLVAYYMVPNLERAYDGEARPHLRPLEAALAGLAGLDLRGLVYLSSTSVYGDRRGGWVDERTPPAPGSPWGRMRLDHEERVLGFCETRKVAACVVRLPEIYGPGRGPVARLRAGYVLGNGSRVSSRIHAMDLAEVLDELGERLDRRLLLACDDEPAPARDVYALAARLLGVELVEEEGSGGTGAPPGGDENRRALLLGSKRCSNAELLAWRGRPLAYPTYREGLPACL